MKIEQVHIYQFVKIKESSSIQEAAGKEGMVVSIISASPIKGNTIEWDCLKWPVKVFVAFAEIRAIAGFDVSDLEHISTYPPKGWGKLMNN